MPDFNPIFPQDWFQTCSEQIKLSDEVTHPYFARLLTADLKLSDTISFLKNLKLTLSENFVLTDSPTTDTIKLLLEEFVALSDENPSISITLDETLKLVDTLETQTGYNKTLSDNLVISDYFCLPIEVELDEVILLPDSHSLDLIKLLSDNLLLNEGETDIFTRTLSDSLKLSDNYSKEWVLDRTLLENLKLTDDFSKTWNLSRTYTDNLVLGDTVVGSTIIDWVITLLDSLKLSDVFSSLIIDYAPVFSETIHLSDYPFGNLGETNVYVYDELTASWVLIEGIEYFKIEKRLNQMSKFNITMPQIEAAQKLYVKEFAKVLMISNQFLILKGRIQKVTYQTTSSCEVEGFGMEAVILDKEYQNATVSPTDPDRVQYDNVSAQSIAKQLLSTNSDGIAPWIMEPRTYGLFASDYGQISIRYEFANTLTALGNLSGAINYDWWVDQTPLTYSNDYFNIASIKGNQTNPLLDSNRQFTITGPNVNAEGTDYQKDITNVANFLKIQGYGDGINQIYTTTYNASPIWTTLSANITNADVIIPLLDVTGFPASGTIRIAEEIITYGAIVGSTLTGCVRGTSGTTALAHRSGCYLEKYELSTAPVTGSSIADYGLMQLTETFREVIDLSTLELIASNELIDRMTPIERINIIPTDPITVAETIETGDLVSIIDAESGLNSNYRIITIIYEFNYGSLSMNLEASNKSLTFIEQMQKEREKNQALQKYMQGATNVYVANNSENCDTGFGCIIRTYIPVETIAINHIKISYLVSQFRSYQSVTGAGSAHSHSLSGITTSVETANHSHGMGDIDISDGLTYGATNSGGHSHNIGTHSHTQGTFSNSNSATTSALAHSHTYSRFSSYSTYTGNIAGSPMTDAGVLPNHSHYLFKELSYSWAPTTAAGSNTHSHIISGEATASESSHTHGITTGITPGVNTLSKMNILIDGVDRTAAIEAQIGHVLSLVSEEEIDVTQWVTTVGAWHTINFSPIGTCYISGELWNQIFIQSI
jgi:hypothetical protein